MPTATEEYLAEVRAPQMARIAELEAIAREIVRVHRDVDGGSDIPIHIYKMARDALGETV